MPELISADRAVRDLAGTTCNGCGGTKKSRMSHCSSCYFTLPRTMRRALYKNVGDGYEEAYTASLEFLHKEKDGAAK